MTVISTQEFVDNQNKYFNMAMNQDVRIKRDDGMFQIRYNPVEETNLKKPKYKQPDADFYRALSAEDFREKLVVVLDNLDKKYASKCK